jgi:hypothetical protein
MITFISKDLVDSEQDFSPEFSRRSRAAPEY